MNSTYDVVIIGGGPAGSTVGTLLCKYNPWIRVLILERERFPRDHVGESQLPVIGQILHEMGVWDKVERANFPIKIGATYRWGKTDDLWDFEFLTDGKLTPEPRPSKYAGQRVQTAFQVDRAIYDQILLDHAAGMGCEVRQETTVREIRKDDDRVEGLVLEDGSEIQAKWYVDCSGHTGILRRAMGVETDCPTNLQNIAIWDYWQNAEWAVSIGVGGTRVQVMSLGYGWIWFIPLGPTRTSIGLIVPAQYAKQSDKRPAELYEEAIRTDPVISKLIKNATSEDRLTTTKDWSFLANRLAGVNWFLAGESAGFADPILAAGMTLAHTGARDVAYTILALEKGDYEADWLKSRYCESNRRQITQHIRFADFWYTHNGVFSDLKDFTKDIAKDLGVEMTSDEAWRWFGRGGFIDHDSAGTGFGGYSMIATKHITAQFLGDNPHYEIVGKSHFELDIENAEKMWGAELKDGRIVRHRCYRQNGKILPRIGLCGWLVGLLKQTKTYDDLVQEAGKYVLANSILESEYPQFRRNFLDTLEALVSDGFVKAWTVDGCRALPDLQFDVSTFLHENRDIARVVETEAQPMA